MTDNTTTLSSSVDTFIGNLRRKVHEARPKVHRSSYTPASAHSIKPIMDKLLADRTDIFVPSTDTGYSANTLYGKLNDGLLWLTHNEEVTSRRNDYCTLRTQVSLRKIDEGVLIYFKAAIRNVVVEKRNIENVPAPDIKWRHDLLAWLQRAKDGEMITLNDVSANDADKQWVYDNIAQRAPDAEVIFNENSIRLIR